MLNKHLILVKGLLLAMLIISVGVLLYDRVFRPPIVITYPNPGDLSRVEGLQPSEAFFVKVNDAPVFVYEALQGWSFFNFALHKTTVQVNVTVSEEIHDWQVRPVAYGLIPQRNGKTFTFTFSQPQKVVLQINGVNGLKLLISVEPLETEVPEADDSSVLYFEPGIHSLGYRYAPPPGIRTIYLAGGAVVEGTLRIEGRRGLKIIGRGVLSMGEWPHDEQEGMNLHHNNGLLVDGITVVNSPGWQLSIGGSSWATIRNVKLLATKDHYNTDGVQTWHQNRVRVEDFFILANDDSFAINLGTTNFVARNGILWNGTNGASFMLGWGGGRDSRDILFEDIDVLENSNCCASVFAVRWGGQEQANISDVTYRNIRVESAIKAPGLPVPMFDMVTGPTHLNRGTLGRVENILFENVSLPFGGGMIKGHDPENGYYGISFVNCTIKGEPVESVEQLNIVLINAFDVAAEYREQAQ
jgi:hypothetical protein